LWVDPHGGGGGGDGGGGGGGGDGGGDGSADSTNPSGSGNGSGESGESGEAEAAAAAASAAFRRHGGHHDNLLLVAEMIGRIAEALSRGEDWETATLTFRGFVGATWWEVASEGDADMERRLKGLAARSMQLMKQSALWSETAAAAALSTAAADANAPADDDKDDEATAAAAAERATMSKVPEVLRRLGLMGFGHLLGICDLNQWSLKIDVPMRNVARRLLQVDEYEVGLYKLNPVES
jgi:hypothetical protein